jgi:tRNA pseudouridine38-40 synthase
MIVRMARYKLTLEYAGTKYSGWQRQKNARTVQGEIERAIGAATAQRQFEFQGAGRTDAGVHALHQVAHLEIAVQSAPEALRRRINDELPADINLLRIDPAPPRFHARHAAVARSYLYQISRRRSAFAKPYVWWVKDALAIEAMREAARHFGGMHDFQSFSDDDPDEKSTDVLVEEVAIGEDGDLVLVRVSGSHFIWKMVRRMVGVLVEVGTGRLDAGAVPGLLRDASAVPAKVTAPASGLFLERVFYAADERRLPLVAAFPVSSAPATGSRARR